VSDKDDVSDGDKDGDNNKNAGSGSEDSDDLFDFGGVSDDEEEDGEGNGGKNNEKSRGVKRPASPQGGRYFSEKPKNQEDPVDYGFEEVSLDMPEFRAMSDDEGSDDDVEEITRMKLQIGNKAVPAEAAIEEEEQETEKPQKPTKNTKNTKQIQNKQNPKPPTTKKRRTVANK